VDIEAVRTFVAVADAGQFQEAAIDLEITQQAVSKRVANLERGLGVSLSSSEQPAASGSPWTGRHSSRTPASCFAWPNAPRFRFGRGSARCVSTS
jgi:hypothetical protein